MILPRRPELIFGASGLTRPIRALHSGYFDWAGASERAPSVRICRFLARIAAGVAALMIGQAAYADLLIEIDKSAQRMIVTLDGELLYQWRVATGAVGYDTPSGAFKPFRMEVDHYSEFSTGLRPTSLDEIYVTVTFIITSKIKWLSDSFLLGVGQRADALLDFLHPDRQRHLRHL